MAFEARADTCRGCQVPTEGTEVIRIRKRASKGILIAAVAAVGATGAVAPTAQAACPDRVFWPAFAAWNDSAMYTAIDNGGFEQGTTGWVVSGDANLVADNSPFRLQGRLDRYSLELRRGSSATTPPICVGSGYPTSRMFGWTKVPTSLSGSTLQVEVLYTDATRGGAMVKKLGSAPTEPVWNAARKMSLAQGQLNIKPDSNGNTFIRYRFTPLYGTTWRIDDVFVDPRFR